MQQQPTRTLSNVAATPTRSTTTLILRSNPVSLTLTCYTWTNGYTWTNEAVACRSYPAMEGALATKCRQQIRANKQRAREARNAVALS